MGNIKSISPNIKNKPYDFKYIANLDTNHAYGCAVESFKTLIKNDFKDMIEKFGFVFINTQVAYFQRAKMPKLLLRKPRPVLSLSAMIDTNFTDNALNTFAFTRDMSHVYDINDYAEPVIVRHSKEDSKKNMSFSFTFTKTRLEISPTIITGTRAKQYNILNFWERVRNTNLDFTEEIIIEVPMPRLMVGYYMSVYKLTNMNDAYHHMKKYSTKPIRLKRNNSTGKFEIFFKYKTKMRLKASAMTIANGSEGNTNKAYTISKPFEIEFSMPSGGYINSFNHDYEANLELSNNTDAENKEDGGEMIIPNPTTDIKYNWMNYEHQEKIAVIDIPFMFGEEEESADFRVPFKNSKSEYWKFYEYLISEEIDPDLYFDLLVYMSEKPCTSETLIINDSELSISETKASIRESYNCVIHMDLGAYNSWLEKDQEANGTLKNESDDSTDINSEKR